jgi:beta-lactamase superfamily II metal-dependent hydrolase
MPDDLLKVFFLDVGQGDCTFVVPPSSECAPILFDCRDAYVAERFVANHGITDLAAVVASHLDEDHIAGLLPFLTTHFEAKRRVEKLVLFVDRVPKRDRNETLRGLVRKAVAWEQEPPHEGFVLQAPHRDREGPLEVARGDGWCVELVLPFVGSVAESLLEGADDPNACSSVLRVTRGGTSILIGGDAPLGSWERLEEARRAARVIRVPHHGGEIREGGKHWTRFEQLYDAVGADLAAISVGTKNGHHHPLELHAAAARRGDECRLLCTQLTPRCHDEPLALRDEALAQAGGVEWPYRHRVVPGHPTKSRRPREEVPCAGTIAASMDATGRLSVLPEEKDAHAALIRRVDHPLCMPPR